MNRKDYWQKALLALFLMLTGLINLGCQSPTNPWAGEPYADPVSYRSPPKAIYAPMPSILPSIDGTAMETDESLEAEFDLLDDGNWN